MSRNMPSGASSICMIEKYADEVKGKSGEGLKIVIFFIIMGISEKRLLIGSQILILE